MKTLFPINPYLTVIFAVNIFLLFFSTNFGTAEERNSEKLISALLADNAGWLQSQVNHLSYTFWMKHTDQDDLYKVDIHYRIPDSLIVVREGKTTDHKIDNEYDTNNTAYPPRLLTILQGTTLFGPLQELQLAPREHQLMEIGEDEITGRKARVMKLLPTGSSSRRALARWEEKLESFVKQPECWYLLTPIKEDQQGGIRAIIQADCLFEEGPGWNSIQEDLSNDPTCLTWELLREGRWKPQERTFRAFLLQSNEGEIPFLLEDKHRSSQIHPQVLLTEGKNEYNEQLYESFKEILPEPERFLAMRVGCGVWGSWYGYSGGGATEDKIWVDRSSGIVLREEGYRDDQLHFAIEYSDYETLSNGKSAPRHIKVQLLNREKPWIFDMRFSIHDGKIHLLRELTEYRGEEEVAKAWITNVQVE